MMVPDKVRKHMAWRMMPAHPSRPGQPHLHSQCPIFHNHQVAKQEGLWYTVQAFQCKGAALGLPHQQDKMPMAGTTKTPTLTVTSKCRHPCLNKAMAPGTRAHKEIGAESHPTNETACSRTGHSNQPISSLENVYRRVRLTLFFSPINTDSSSSTRSGIYVRHITSVARVGLAKGTRFWRCNGREASFVVQGNE